MGGDSGAVCDRGGEVVDQSGSNDQTSVAPPQQPPFPLLSPLALTSVVSKGEEWLAPPECKRKASDESVAIFVEEIATASSTKGHLSRNGNSHEQCRVCQLENEEVLIDLGCQCRGELAKAHRSCIDRWFCSRGSNKCEICHKQAAMNVPPPPPLPAVNSWIWRVDPTIRRSLVTEDRRQACSTPLCVAFVIVVGGLLLDVLLSMTFGVSAVPINVIIGVVIILGLGTSLRLMLDCYHEWSSRRPVPRLDTNVNITYLPPL